MKETFEEHAILKEKLMTDLMEVIRKAHNDSVLQTPDIIGCINIVWFDYLTQCRNDMIYLKSSSDDQERGVV